jgi:hypothetical protein
MVQHIQIIKFNTAYKKRKKHKPYDHLNRCRKTLGQNSTFFMIKALMKLRIERMYLNIIKGVFYKYIAKNTLNGEKTETISSKGGTRQGIQLFPL